MVERADRLIPEHRNSHRLPPILLRAAWEAGMIDLEIARKFLRYEPDTGFFFWVEKPSNAVRPGAKAGYVNWLGYVMIGLNGERSSAHRLAWAFMYGDYPSDELCVDHINGLKSDNRISNLRLLSNSHNQQNRRALPKKSSTGIRGVQWRPKTQSYQVRIMVNGKRIELGSYKRICDAIQTRIAEEMRIWPFSPVHYQNCS